MLMGVARVPKLVNPKTRIVALEQASSPVLSEGRAGEHYIEELGAGFVPPLLDSTLYDEARAIHEAESRDMCRRLARRKVFSSGPPRA